MNGLLTEEDRMPVICQNKMWLLRKMAALCVDVRNYVTFLGKMNTEIALIWDLLNKRSKAHHINEGFCIMFFILQIFNHLLCILLRRKPGRGLNTRASLPPFMKYDHFIENVTSVPSVLWSTVL